MIEIDPAYPERYPSIFRAVCCSVCRACWLDMRSRRCIYGGPFSGYVHVEPEKSKDNFDNSSIPLKEKETQ